MDKKEDKLVLKICINTWENESRDQRELSVYQEMGARVIVLAKGKRGDHGRRDTVAGFEVHRMSTRPVHVPIAGLNRFFSCLSWANYVRKLKPDVISGHDLPGVLIGWLSQLGVEKGKKAKLIYDSHELESGRNVQRGNIQKRIIFSLERFLIKKCDTTIVVCNSIADELVRIYGLEDRPVVVRNIPFRWEVDRFVCEKKRAEFMNQLHIEDGFIMMYHGSLCNGRGIERCIDLLKYNEKLYLIILGNAYTDEYKNGLLDMIDASGAKDRIILHDAVPNEELWEYIGSADVNMVLIEPVSKSYYYALPNKLFEAIQAGIPVIGSDLPEIREIINTYGVGCVCNVYDTAGIYSAIHRLMTRDSVVREMIDNEKKAAQILCWEMEKEELKKVIRHVS